MERELFRGLVTPNEVRAAEADLSIKAHNTLVRSDAEADSCRCPLCLADDDLNSPLTDASRLAAGVHPADPRLAARDVAPAVASSPIQAGAHRPALRGPVQDESVTHDPIDAQAMRVIEGRSAEPVEAAHEL